MPPNFGLASIYFPSQQELQKGFVSKYYKHTIPTDNNQSNSTDIEYRAFSLFDSDTLLVRTFDAGMRLKWQTKYHFANDKSHLINQFQIYRGDTIDVEIVKNVEMDWAENEAFSEYIIETKTGYKTNYSSTQVAKRDTIIETLSCKIISKEEKMLVVSPEGDTIKNDSKQEFIFAENMGLYARSLSYDVATINWELIEQMSMTEFEKRANHGKHRIAYIDPQNTIDKNLDFKPCDKEDKIGDYYNCDFRGELRGGKGSWWRVLKADLEPEKMHNETGFLSIHFLMNCEGKIGRFTTDEADLNYKKKKFNEETVEHFYEMVAKQKDWQVCQDDDLLRDTYVYVTFKLKDGKVIDILP